ncbi:hypothetical protein GCM10022223_07570 [Kineosporia mesophila]|uniref:Uncharacterized protein n=1 Tax=Kineosporia mesophila TaxID=566012 RepID=A0ABP6Z2G2_9ACTN
MPQPVRERTPVEHRQRPITGPENDEIVHDRRGHGDSGVVTPSIDERQFDPAGPERGNDPRTWPNSTARLTNPTIITMKTDDGLDPTRDAAAPRYCHIATARIGHVTQGGEQGTFCATLHLTGRYMHGSRRRQCATAVLGKG